MRASLATWRTSSLESSIGAQSRASSGGGQALSRGPYPKAAQENEAPAKPAPLATPSAGRGWRVRAFPAVDDVDDPWVFYLVVRKEAGLGFGDMLAATASACVRCADRYEHDPRYAEQFAAWYAMAVR